MVMWQIWLIIAGLFLILEMVTVGFLVFWFSIGALFALISSLFIDNIVIQTAIFVVSSTLLIFCTRPFVNKYINKKTVPTNAYSIIGKHGVVTKNINSSDSTGLVKIGSEVWTAVVENDTPLEKGTEIEVKKIDGVKVVVKSI